MPYSSELGMRVYDPQEGERYGLQVGQMAARAFEAAKNRQLEERQLRMMEEQQRAKASALMMQNAGFAELQDAISKGTPFEQAFFNAAPKLYAGNPQALGRVVQTMAREKANETYRNIMVEKAREAAEANQEIRRLHAEEALARTNKPPAMVQESQWVGKLENERRSLAALVKSNPNRIDLRDMLNQREAQLKAYEDRRKSSLAEDRAARLELSREKFGLDQDKFGLEQEKFSETQRKNARAAEFKIDQDKQIAEWRSQLSDAQRALATIKQAKPSLLPWGDHAADIKKKQEATEKEISDLQKQISDRMKELRSTGGGTGGMTISAPPQPGDESGDFSERQQAPVAAPAPAAPSPGQAPVRHLRWTPQGYVPMGTNAPSASPSPTAPAPAPVAPSAGPAPRAAGVPGLEAIGQQLNAAVEALKSLKEVHLNLLGADNPIKAQAEETMQDLNDFIEDLVEYIPGDNEPEPQ